MKRKPLTQEMMVERLLKDAKNHLDARNQWLKMKAYERVYMYETKAEGLIEFLEVLHCGSIGGFGVFKGKRQEDSENNRNIDNRLEWLCMVFQPK